MKTRNAFLAALWFLPLPLAAQAPSVITMDHEPHHHLVFHNSYVNVFYAKATPGDALLLHRHDHDAVAIAIGDQTVTVGVPGKPDVHSKNADGQVRMQRSGYVHSTRVDGDAAYFTVAVELLHPQTGARNLCAPVLAGEPLNCQDTSANKSTGQPQFESDQVRIEVVRVRPHESLSLGHAPDFLLIVPIDSASISPGSANERDSLLHPGDFVWFDKGGPARKFDNKGDQEARFVEFIFRPSLPAK
jgi:hypothetical protein